MIRDSVLVLFDLQVILFTCVLALKQLNSNGKPEYTTQTRYQLRNNVHI